MYCMFSGSMKFKYNQNQNIQSPCETVGLFPIHEIETDIHTGIIFYTTWGSRGRCQTILLVQSQRGFVIFPAFQVKLCFNIQQSYQQICLSTGSKLLNSKCHKNLADLNCNTLIVLALKLQPGLSYKSQSCSDSREMVS